MLEDYAAYCKHARLITSIHARGHRVEYATPSIIRGGEEEEDGREGLVSHAATAAAAAGPMMQDEAMPTARPRPAHGLENDTPATTAAAVAAAKRKAVEAKPKSSASLPAAPAKKVVRRL